MVSITFICISPVLIWKKRGHLRCYVLQFHCFLCFSLFKMLSMLASLPFRLVSFTSWIRSWLYLFLFFSMSTSHFKIFFICSNLQMTMTVIILYRCKFEKKIILFIMCSLLGYTANVYIFIFGRTFRISFWKSLETGVERGIWHAKKKHLH